ncbi:MAG TPA: hypothetical protein VF885_00810 [Arthrobacter sp.]
MKFGTLLVTGQLILGSVIGLIAAALAVWGNNEGLVAVLTAGAIALILSGLIMATTFPQVVRTAESRLDD